MNTKLIKPIVFIFFLLYLITSIWIFLVMALDFLLDGKTKIELVLPFIVTAVVSFGLYKKVAWVLPVIIVIAAIGIVNHFFFPSFDIWMILAVGVLLFEIYFFTTKNVRAYFKAKGKFFF